MTSDEGRHLTLGQPSSSKDSSHTNSLQIKWSIQTPHKTHYKNYTKIEFIHTDMHICCCF